MKNIFAVAGLFFLGCAATDNRLADVPQSSSPGDPPQKAIVGEGTVMPGAYDSHRMPTGQFTGKERTSSSVVQQPVTPPESDPRHLSREPSAEQGTGAGSLGQSGVRPGSPVTSSTLLATPTNPSLVPSETSSDRETGTETQLDAAGAPPGAQEDAANSRGSVSRTPTEPQRLRTPPDPSTTKVGSLESQVHAALSAEGKPDQFDVDAMDGNITLRGFVASAEEKERVFNEVSKLPGVRSVRNELQVRNSARPGTK